MLLVFGVVAGGVMVAHCLTQCRPDGTFLESVPLVTRKGTRACGMRDIAHDVAPYQQNHLGCNEIAQKTETLESAAFRLSDVA